MALSPWGWSLPMTSPTTRALLTCARSGRRPISAIWKRMRRCTGLRPSRASGSARGERALPGLEAVARVGQRAGVDDRVGVLQEGAAHLLVDVDVEDALGELLRG